MENFKTATTAMEDSIKANETQTKDDLNVTARIRTKNPLLTNLVVSSVLKNLNVKDLKKCRLVNKMWNFESTLFLKSNSVVRLEHAIDEEENFNISKYLKEMIHFGHTTFYFRYCIDLDRSIILNSFFRFLGNQIKSLRLSVRINRPSELEIFQTITENTPNLEDLKIDLYVLKGFRTNQFDEEFRSAWLNIKPLDKVRKLTLNFQSCTDYKSLMESNFNPVPVLTAENMVEFIVKLVPKSESLILDRNSISQFSNEILKKYTNSEGTIYNINMHVQNEDQEATFQVLSKWPVSLKKLNLYVVGRLSDFDTTNFHTLLNRHCSTLEELRIHFLFLYCVDSVQIQINMPQFLKLRKLNITMDKNCKAGKIDFRFIADLKDHFPLLEMEEDKIVEMFSKLHRHHSALFNFNYKLEELLCDFLM